MGIRGMRMVSAFGLASGRGIGVGNKAVPFSDSVTSRMALGRKTMKGKGSREERETIINFNEHDGNASVWTASEPIYRRLLRLGYEPIEDKERSATFELPKKHIRLPRPPRKLSETHKVKIRGRFGLGIQSGD